MCDSVRLFHCEVSVVRQARSPTGLHLHIPFTCNDAAAIHSTGTKEIVLRLKLNGSFQHAPPIHWLFLSFFPFLHLYCILVKPRSLKMFSLWKTVTVWNQSGKAGDSAGHWRYHERGLFLTWHYHTACPLHSLHVAVATRAMLPLRWRLIVHSDGYPMHFKCCTQQPREVLYIIYIYI